MTIICRAIRNYWRARLNFDETPWILINGRYREKGEINFPDYNLDLHFLFRDMASYNPANPAANAIRWDDNIKIRMVAECNWYNVCELQAALLEMKAMPLHTVAGRRAALDVLNSVAMRLCDHAIDATHRFRDTAFDEMVCEEVAAWRGEFVNLRMALANNDRAAELSAQQGAATNSRATMDANVALPRIISEMLRQLMSRRSTINRAKFESMYRLDWA